jgi:Na+/melibiose symporter-like transporter
MSQLVAQAPVPTPATTPRLGWGAKILYGLGDVSGSIKMVLFGLFVLFFYTTVMGLPATWVGIAGLIGLVWDAIIDPYIGQLSDRIGTGLGRRHSFMLVGAVVMGVSAWALFSPPRGLPPELTFGWLLTTSLCLRTANSFFATPYYAIGADLSVDYHERTVITGVRGGLALLGAMMSAGLSFVVFFPNTGNGQDPKLEFANYPVMGLTFGAVMTATALVAALSTLNRRSQSSEPERGSRTPRLNGFLDNQLIALRNRAFLALFLSHSLFFLGVVINNSLSLYFLTYYVEVSESARLSALQFAFHAGAIVGIVVCLRIRHWIEKRRLYTGGTLATAGVLIAAVSLFGPGHTFGTGASIALVIGHALAGLLASVLWAVPTSMLADVIDQDELLNGQRRGGTFFGLYSFGQQMGTGLSLLITGFLLDSFAGLVPGQAAQSTETVGRIALLYGLLPAALLAIAAGFSLRYPLDRAKVLSVQRELHRRSEVCAQ